MSVDHLGRLVGREWNAVPVTRLVAVLLLAVVLVGLWWWARGGAPYAAGLALAATVVLAPVFHPWYATWPLAVLAATWTPSPALLTRWLLVPCAVASALILPDGYNLALATRVVGAVAMTALVIVLVVGGAAGRPAARARTERARAVRAGATQAGVSPDGERVVADR